MGKISFERDRVYPFDTIESVLEDTLADPIKFFKNPASLSSL
jgi:hypothetical protein